MKISDKKALVKEYFERAAAIKEKRAFDEKHKEFKIREGEEMSKILAERKHSMILHESENVQKKSARQKEVDNRQVFLKLDTALNVI